MTTEGEQGKVVQGMGKWAKALEDAAMQQNRDRNVVKV